MARPFDAVVWLTGVVVTGVAGCVGAMDDPPPVNNGARAEAGYASAHAQRPPPPPLVLAITTVDDTAAANDMSSAPPVQTTQTELLRFDEHDTPERAQTVIRAYGDPSVGGIEATRYAVELVKATGEAREIFHGEATGDGTASITPVDLEGDGHPELLIEESGSYMTCDLGGGSLTERWLVIDAWGRVLYRSELSSADYELSGDFRDRRERARVVSMPDGRSAIELRSPAGRRMLTVARR